MLKYVAIHSSKAIIKLFSMHLVQTNFYTEQL